MMSADALNLIKLIHMRALLELCASHGKGQPAKICDLIVNAYELGLPVHTRALLEIY